MDNIGIHNYGDIENPLFKATDVAKLLNLSHIYRSVKNFTNKDKVKKIHETKGGPQSLLFITESGFYKLLNITRNTATIDVCNKIKNKNNNPIYVNHYKETIFVKKILEAFDSEIMIEQFKVLQYKIDLYFPDYKIAIEFDENHHKLQKENDDIRMINIQKILNCIFIRVNENYNIFEIINKIYKEIIYSKNIKQSS